MRRSRVESVAPMADRGHLEVGRLLGQAFEDDPLWSAVFPADRLPRLVSMFTALTRTTLAAGGIVEVTPGVSGAALWMAPGRDNGLWSMIRTGFALPRFVLRLPAQDRQTMLGVLDQFAAHRKAWMPSSHWYLAAVGVDPARHGEGLGSALLQSGMHRSDRDGRPIYLETETESNVHFYQHLGFEVKEVTVAAGLGLPVWLMCRDSDSGN